MGQGTHWHPFHVGDGRVGKSKDVLSARQIETTIRGLPLSVNLWLLREFPCRFADKKRCIWVREIIIGWIDDFVPPNLVYGWIVNILHGPPVEFIADLEERQVGKTVADLDRSDLAQLGSGFRPPTQARTPVQGGTWTKN